MRTSGRKTVATPGVAERLADAPRGQDEIIIIAIAENAGLVFVGTEGVLAESGKEQGIPLAAGEAVKIDASDPYDIWIDARTAGDGVTWW